MLQHGYQFFVYLMTSFFSKKKAINIPFLYLFFTFVQNFKPKKKSELWIGDKVTWGWVQHLRRWHREQTVKR